MADRFRIELSVAALAASLLTTGCSGESGARDVLQQQGYTQIEIERDGGSNFQFTATKDGGDCSGSVEVSGAFGFSRSRVSATCVSKSSAPEPAPTEAVEHRPTVPEGAPQTRPSTAPVQAPLVAAFGESLQYDRPSLEIEAPRGSGAAVAAAFLQAIAAGDRPWVADHGGEHLRKGVLEDSITPMQVGLTRLRGVSLFPSGGGVNDAGLQVSKFMLSAEGRESMEFAIVFDEHGVQGLHINGPGWPDMATLFGEPGLQVHGVYYLGPDGAPFDEPEIAEGSDLDVHLSMSGAARRDGKVAFDYQIIHTYAGKSDTFNADPASFETPGPFHLTVNIPTPEPGDHHIEVRIHDRIADTVLPYKFTASVTRP